MNGTLAQTMKKLRLSGMARTLDVRLQEAAVNRLSHEEFLELVFQDETTVRGDRMMARRVKAACFNGMKTLDHFNWDFNPKIDRRKILSLAVCAFIKEAKDILFVGPPGTGKSHLAQAIGYQAIRMGYSVYYRSVFDLVKDLMSDEAFRREENVMRNYLRPDLLIIDDMGLKQLPKGAGEHVFEVIMRRYENRSTIMTSNRPAEEWGKLIGDVPTAGAILDRFLHHAEIITVEGRSYRLREKAKIESDENGKG
jgi:DNA replication protein DnaC